MILGAWLRSPETTHYATLTSLIAANAKNANGAEGYEGRALSRWDGDPVPQGSAHCLVNRSMCYAYIRSTGF